MYSKLLIFLLLVSASQGRILIIKDIETLRSIQAARQSQNSIETADSSKNDDMETSFAQNANFEPWGGK